MLTRRQIMKAAAACSAVTRLRADTDPSLRTAMEAVTAAIPLAESDPERPRYHFHPPANWNNDPNGTLFYRGWHHLFYQHNPAASRGGNQHWGHARSRDLVNWEHLPIAMTPSQDKGERALFSGGAIVAKDGRPRILYTSIGKPQPEQWMALPKDDELITWEKFAGNPVLTQTAHGAKPIGQWRDPFMFHERGQTYMVCGGTLDQSQGGHGEVQLYRALKDDLSSWKHLGAVFRYRDRETWNIECPNLFRLGNKWVLLMSPQRPCEYFIGSLDLARVQFIPETHGVLDAGDAYASNISVDDKGRTVLWLWGRTNTAPGKGWNGVMALPRILSIGTDGYLRQQPAPEFETLRGEPRTFPEQVLGEKPVVLDGLSGDTLEIEAEFSGGNNASFGIELRRSREGKAAAVVAIQRGVLSVGNARTYVGTSGRYQLRVFLDKRCLEVYVNGGATALYSIVDANPQDQGVALFAPPAGAGGGRGGAVPQPVRMERLKAWTLQPAKFSLDRFHL